MIPCAASLRTGVDALSQKHRSTTIQALPFVKWAGGKRGIIHEITQRMPASYGTYFEPFVGGGALFFALGPQKSVISDKNSQLITAYRIIQNDVENLMNALDEHERHHSRDYYYEMRAMNPDDLSPCQSAARFIYLNKTCYNGLYRVNKNGEFNVPYGHRKRVNLYDRDNLLRCHMALQHAEIQEGDFCDIQPKKGDFVYFDPPYFETFTQYTQDNFAAQEQQRLCEFCCSLDKQGVHFMLSNSDTPFIRDLYQQFHIDVIQAPRHISCNGQQRGKIQEVIVYNG